MLQGTNLTGGEIDYMKFAGRAPVSGQDYLFVSTADIDICVAAGMNCFRLVFSHEAMISNTTYQTTLYSRVAYMRGKGCTVVLDIHPGDAALAPSLHGTTILPGNSAEASLVLLWKSLATTYKTDQGVHFGIMNEPNRVTSSQWFRTAQAVLSAIRAVGATNQVWMPGAGWSGAGNWAQVNGPNWNLVDTIPNKLGIQVHMYFDANSGGGDSTIWNQDVGVERLKNATDWCRSKGLKLFLGEVGLSAANGIGPDTWRRTLAYINANQDVIAGWCWWAYGPPSWWGSYRFTLCNNSAQMQLVFPPPPAIVDPVPELLAEVKRWSDRVVLLESRMAQAKAFL